MKNIYMIQPQFSEDAVHIQNSHLIASRSVMESILEDIITDPRCPRSVSQRTTHSLRREWETHNLLYDLHLFRSHTADVDLNDALPPAIVAYHILGAIYRLIHIRNK